MLGALFVLLVVGGGAAHGETKASAPDSSEDPARLVVRLAQNVIEAARAEGVGRYVMVSAMGAANPPADGGEVYREYLRAKAGADRALEESGLAFTIVRPGGLTDEPGTGRVEVAGHLAAGRIPRGDVAAVLARCLTEPGTENRGFDVRAGTTPVATALAALY